MASSQKATPSKITPKRAPGTSGRRPPNYPDLHFQSIGKALGISATYVGRILNGVSQPSMKVAQRLAALMGWTIDDVNRLYTKHPQSLNNEESDKGARSRGKSRNHRSSKSKPYHRPDKPAAK